MPKINRVDVNVLDAAKERLREHYLAGDTVVYSMSGGKDSTVCMELGIEIAKETGNLPIHVQTRDEEIMLPGTFEYMERIYERLEVNMIWNIAGQAIINSFSRLQPYWWVFDPDEQDKWVRQPPPFANWVKTQVIEGLVSTDVYSVAPGKRLIAVIGLRAQESLTRLTRIASTEGALTKRPTAYGAYTLAPIYDWTDEDVWKYIGDNKLDYNEAYNHLYRGGVPKSRLRIAPPTMIQELDKLKIIYRLFPQWYERFERRIPGMKLAAQYGKRVMTPLRRQGETWKDCLYRYRGEATDQGANWLVERIDAAIKYAVEMRHPHHSSIEFPMTQKHRCNVCPPKCPGSWEELAKSLWNGDPWRSKNQILDALDLRIFRASAKGWYEDGKTGSLTW